jgi:sugar lactone lactonase YvrE
LAIHPREFTGTALASFKNIMTPAGKLISCRPFLLTIFLFAAMLDCFAQADRIDLKEPQGLAIDTLDNLFVADTSNNRVLRMDPSGKISIVAGTGVPGFSGDGDASIKAMLNSPKGLATDPLGNLFIADSGNHRIRKINLQTGIIRTVAGTGQAGFNGDGQSASLAQLNEPRSVALDQSGNLFIADARNDRIRRVDAHTEQIGTVAGNGHDPGLNDEKLGDMLKFIFGNPLGDGGKATKAFLSEPSDVFLDASSNLFIADTGHSRIRRVDAKSKRITTVIATGGFVASAREGAKVQKRAPGSPLALAIGKNGNLYIASSSNQIQRLDAKSRKIAAIAGDAEGRKGYRGDNEEPNKAFLSSPAQILLDSKGNLVIADTGNNRIRYVDFGKNLISTIGK